MWPFLLQLEVSLYINLDSFLLRDAMELLGVDPCPCVSCPCIVVDSMPFLFSTEGYLGFLAVELMGGLTMTLLVACGLLEWRSGIQPGPLYPRGGTPSGLKSTGAHNNRPWV
jgi:hypothetical protein